MNKENTVGVRGEKIFKDLLIKNKIDFIDRTKRKENIDTHYYEKGQLKIHIRNTYKHGYDLIVNGLNIEIKTSTAPNNKINFTWAKNDTENIDYVIGIYLNGKKVTYYIFDNYFITSGDGVGFNLKNKSGRKTKHLPITEKDLISILKGG